MNKKDLSVWLKSGKHLPVFLRDFHDQKDIFKCVGNAEGPHGEEISRIDGHCYVIDKFLWFMAEHGYTLQRSRAKMEFRDLGQTMKAKKKAQVERLQQIMREQRGLKP